MQFDERVLQLTPIHRRLGGGIDTSDSEASLPRADDASERRFDPHTPLNPRPAANTIRRDISTPLDPYAAPNFFLSTPAEERARSRALDNMSTAASPGSPSAWRSSSDDPQEAADDESKESAARRPITLQRPDSSHGAARTPRSTPRSASSERRSHRGETSGRRRRSGRDGDDDEDISVEDLEPMLHSLHKVTRELRKALVREAGTARFASLSSYPPPSFGLARGGAAHAPYGQPSQGYFQGSPRSPLGSAYSYASPSYSLNTRLQLAAACSRAHGSYGHGAPVHRSSFSHAGSHFLLTVSSFG